MAQEPRIRRETPSLQPIVQGWSDWYTIFLSRRGRVICEDKLKDLKYKRCAIYEWRAVRNGESYVVYVGSTCRDPNTAQCARGTCSLIQRVKEYASNRPHKVELIDDALGKGFNLQIRFKKYNTQEEALEFEHKHLDKFDYAWNKRRNGNIRHILNN